MIEDLHQSAAAKVEGAGENLSAGKFRMSILEELRLLVMEEDRVLKGLEIRRRSHIQANYSVANNMFPQAQNDRRSKEQGKCTSDSVGQGHHLQG